MSLFFFFFLLVFVAVSRKTISRNTKNNIYLISTICVQFPIYKKAILYEPFRVFFLYCKVLTGIITYTLIKKHTGTHIIQTFLRIRTRNLFKLSL